MMHTLQYLHQKIDQLSEAKLEKVAAYIAEMERETNSEKAPGLATVLQRSSDYDAGRVEPVDKETFWKNLQRRIG